MIDDERRRRSGPGRRPQRRGGRPDEDDRPLEDDFDQDGPPPRSRRGPPARRGRPRARRPARERQRSGLFEALFGSKRTESRRRIRPQEFDWEGADEEYEERPRRQSARYDRDEDDYGDEDDGYERARRSRTREKRHDRQSLMDLSTPVFGYAAVLPREASGVHPAYATFRQEVLGALQRLESEAQANGIDREDAADARYALALFMDEQVALSEWTGRAQWAEEPLSMVLLSDPEGGENFFRKLEGFSDRRRALKEIYLVCLSLGYRGRYAELDPSQQGPRLGEIRQRVLRSIHPEPLDSMDVLFPEAYEPAAPIDDEAPPPPIGWIVASAAVVVISVLVYFLLYWAAGRLPEEPVKTLEKVRIGALHVGGHESSATPDGQWHRGVRT